VKHTRTNLLRRIVTWAAGVVLVVSVAAWVVSIFGAEWRAGSRLLLSLAGGEIQALAGEVDAIGWEYDSAGLIWPVWRLPFLIDLGGGYLWGLVVPLWVPASLAGVTFGTMCRLRRRGGAGTGERHCGAYGYDLTGIIGRCPECGARQGN
jgi:hypothetical protein